AGGRASAENPRSKGAGHDCGIRAAAQSRSAFAAGFLCNLWRVVPSRHAVWAARADSLVLDAVPERAGLCRARRAVVFLCAAILSAANDSRLERDESTGGFSAGRVFRDQ